MNAILILLLASTFTVNVQWTDNSDDEDGFIIEERITKGGFRELGRVEANVTSYWMRTTTADPDEGQRCYRVRAFKLVEIGSKYLRSTPSNADCKTVEPDKEIP